MVARPCSRRVAQAGLRSGVPENLDCKQTKFMCRVGLRGSFFAVLDVNDNAPTFLEAPYKFRIKETVAVGDVVFSKVREMMCVK